MFGVFRLRSGREIESYSPPLLSSLCLALPSPLLLMMRPWNAERDFISLRRAPLLPLFLLFFPLPQIFHLDLIPVLSLGDTIGPRDLSMGPDSINRGDHFGSCYVLWVLFTMIVKN